MKKKIIIIMLGALLCCGGLAQAVPITIAISGSVTSLGGYTQVIPSSIHEGTTFNGTYTYNSSTSDSDPDPNRGIYKHDAPYGISIVMGGYEFKTPSNHVGKFDIIIKNDDTTNGMVDYYTVFSTYQNIPSIDFAPDSIIWNLRDSDHTALLSDALPVTSPILTDWNYNALAIYGSYGPNLTGVSIYGVVTQAVLIPEPLTGALMVIGIFFLKRRK